MNLYSCLLGFADVGKPASQLRLAMVAAFLSAIYDYETDWCHAKDAKQSLFATLLNRYVESAEAREQAYSLFATDLSGNLSKDGLERGVIAFKFYRIVIGSVWLAEYPDDQLTLFGRKLQMVDDLLDLSRDRQRGEKNCFLTADHEQYVKEVQEFINSKFFRDLVVRAPIYSLIGWWCQHTCNKLQGTVLTLGQFVKAPRLLTALYAFAVVIAGFKLSGSVPALAFVTASAFSCVAACIMLFNDIMDRQHDTWKPGAVAITHTWSVMQLCLAFGVFTFILLLVSLALSKVWLALFVVLVWVTGICYSLPPVRRWYIGQAVIVALCSAAPVLCGAVYQMKLSMAPLLLFVALTLIVFMREIVKDMADVEHDRGYKETIVVRYGHAMSVFVLIGLCPLVVVPLAMIPVQALQSAGYSLGVTQATFALLLMHPERHWLAKWGIDVSLVSLLLAALTAA
ncbi:MAG: UbiA family prenyltransferase [bacterium]|nr:UbiA family prenyltransferase [bacterium]